MNPEAILEFLECFRLMNDTSEKSKLISIKVPHSLLGSFRRKCELEEIKYQTKIKRLMEQWLKGTKLESNSARLFCLWTFMPFVELDNIATGF